MPYATINKGSSYFNTITYAGTSATNNITVGFQPDFVWIKNRTDGLSHYLNDSVRGAYKILFSNTTGAEFNGTATSDGVSAFTSTGFTLLNGTNVDNYNKTANNYVAWNWLASNTTVANTSGTISSTVSVNTTAGFSIISYTGNGSAGATVGHGLGVTPKMVIIKNRSATTSWPVFTSMITTQSSGSVFTSTIFNIGDKSGGALSLNLTGASTSYAMDAQTNGSGAFYIAYCFAEVKGYSKFGSYTGNGSANGPFTYTGFRPAFVMIKSTGTGDWCMFDTTRNPSNAVNLQLFADTSQSESGIGSDNFLDILSNGFKNRNTASDKNANGGTYIYMAFASNPFVTSGGIPVTAR